MFYVKKNTDAFYRHTFYKCIALCTMLYNRTYRKDLEVLDLLMVAQGEHERPGITLAVAQQE